MCERGDQHHTGAHHDQEWLRPIRGTPYDIRIDKDARQYRNDEDGYSQGQRGERRVHDTRIGAAQAPLDGGPKPFPGPALETVRGFEGKCDPREGCIELLLGDDSRARGWIVQKDLAPGEAFENHEMIEGPEDDKWRAHLSQFGRLLFVPPAIQSKAPRSSQDVCGFAAVARNAARAAQRFERLMTSEVRQDDGETGSAAFEGFDLQHGRRLYTFVSHAGTYPPIF